MPLNYSELQKFKRPFLIGTLKYKVVDALPVDPGGNEDFLLWHTVDETLYIWDESLGAYIDISNAGGTSILEDLNDIEIASLGDGQVLAYELASLKWKNIDVPSGGSEKAFAQPMHGGEGINGFSKVFQGYSSLWRVQLSNTTGRLNYTLVIPKTGSYKFKWFVVSQATISDVDFRCYIELVNQTSNSNPSAWNGLDFTMDLVINRQSVYEPPTTVSFTKGDSVSISLYKITDEGSALYMYSYGFTLEEQ